MAGATRTDSTAFPAFFLGALAIGAIAMGYFIFSAPRPSVQSHDPTSKIETPKVSAPSLLESEDRLRDLRANSSTSTPQT